MPIDELTYPPRAIKYLAEHLKKGNLVLFIGAGVSQHMGLPNWSELVNRMRKEVGLNNCISNASAEELQKAAGEVRIKFKSEKQYYNLIKQCLYSDLKELTSKVVQSELLSAIGALLMVSKRGNIRRVVTFNFDSVLEWYLSINGFITKVFYNLPALEGAEDVHVYHPHGFLPHPSLKLPDSNFLILDMASINKRLVSPDDQWYAKTHHLLRSGLCIFLGLSERTFSDRALDPLLTVTAEELRRKRPTGVWLLLKDETVYEKADKEVNIQVEEFTEKNIVPLQFNTGGEIADFLLKICQKAAAKIVT